MSPFLPLAISFSSLRLCHCSPVSLAFPSPLPTSHLALHTTPWPAEPQAEHSGLRLRPGVSARGAHGTGGAAHEAGACALPPAAAGIPAGEQPSGSPRGAPASDPVGAPEITTSPTHARFFQSLPGGAAGVGIPGPGSPQAPASQTDWRGTPGPGGGSGEWAAPQAQGHPGRAGRGWRRGAFRIGQRGERGKPSPQEPEGRRKAPSGARTQETDDRPGSPSRSAPLR